MEVPIVRPPESAVMHADPLSPVAQYEIHGVGIGIRTDDPRLGRAAHAALSIFSLPLGTLSGKARSGRYSVSLFVHMSCGPAPTPCLESASVWLDCGWIRGLSNEHYAYLEYEGRYVARLALQGNRIDAWVPEDMIQDEWTIVHRVLLPLLLEALCARGLFTLHAAALEHTGRAVLFPAESGSGKTTLALALVRGGFRLLSDDSPLLRSVGGRLTVHAFPERVNVMAQTCAFFPELAPYWALSQVAGQRDKAPIDVSDVYGDCIASQAGPAAVVFTSIAHGERTVIEPMLPLDALHRLVVLAGPNATPEVNHTKFEMLMDLVSSTPCYQMHTARDFDVIPTMLLSVLDSDAGARSS